MLLLIKITLKFWGWWYWDNPKHLVSYYIDLVNRIGFELLTLPHLAQPLLRLITIVLLISLVSLSSLIFTVGFIGYLLLPLAPLIKVWLFLLN